MLEVLEDTRGCLEGLMPILEEVRGKVDRLVDQLEAEKRVEVLVWLGNLPYGEWHKNAAAMRMGGSGGWLLEKEAYLGWKADKRSCLWIHGVRKSLTFEFLETQTDRYCSWSWQDNSQLFHH